MRYYVYVWGCYVGLSQGECLTPQFLTLSFHAGDKVCSQSLVGTYWHAQGTLDFLSSLSTGLNSNLYPLAWGEGWGWALVRRRQGEWHRMSLFTLLVLLWYLFYFFRSWLLLSSKYTAILASSPGGRGRKNLFPSAPL